MLSFNLIKMLRIPLHWSKFNRIIKNLIFKVKKKTIFFNFIYFFQLLIKVIKKTNKLCNNVTLANYVKNKMNTIKK
jgi:hypothetical protein